MYTFKDLVEHIEKHLSKIDCDSDRYSMDKIQSLENKTQRVVVRYNNRELVKFDYFVSNRLQNDGTLTVHGRFSIGVLNHSDWYNREGEIIHVDEFFRCGFENQKSLFFPDVLNKILPISNQKKIDLVNKTLEKYDLEKFSVRFDSLQNRYIVFADLTPMLGLTVPSNEYNSTESIFLYKYITLETYFKMLMGKSFRMNSIVSMNDESESLFLSDGLCKVYTDNLNNEKYERIVKNSRTLISSLTDQDDSSLMWRLYGDSGKGVCIGLRVPRKKVTKIHYLSERNAGYAKLKECVDDLRDEGINIYFKDIDNFTNYTKSDGFKYEDEYRITFTCDEKDLSWAKYGNLLSPYRDFSFNGNYCELIDIQIHSLLIGAKLPNFEVNYPLLVDLTNRVFNVSIINLSKEDKFRE